jgi:hypothetical protein
MLTGAYTSPSDFSDGDFRKFAPRFSPENFPEELEISGGDSRRLQRRKGVRLDS